MDVENKQVIIAFSGTSDINDMNADMKSVVFYSHVCKLPNLDDGQPDVKYSHLHRGFCDHYTSFSKVGLTAATMGLADDNPTFSVLVTGHSLGGAAAILAAVDLVHRFKLDANWILLYAFGSPRVGDGTFYGEAKRPLPLLLLFCCNVFFSSHPCCYDYAFLGMTKKLPNFFRVVHRYDACADLALCCTTLPIHAGKCRIDKKCPYHGGQEVWYSDDMVPDAEYKLCGVDGDNSCGNGIRKSVHDHLEYFANRLGTIHSPESVEL